jgi:hypothetical protein
LLAGNSKQGRALRDQKGPEALAGAEACVAHGLEQSRWPLNLLLFRLMSEQPIEKNVDILGNLIEAFLKLCSRVHAVLFTLFPGVV